MQSGSFSQNSTLMTRKIKRKRSQAYGVCLDLNNSLNILREQWFDSGYYQKILIKKEADAIQRQFNIQKGQYKTYVKKRLDEFGKSVVDALF